MLRGLHGTHALIGRLLYGTGMRIVEALRLRIKDIEFERRAIVVRDGKGAKDRITVLPGSLMTPLKQQVRRAHTAHQADLKKDLAMYLPHALAYKYPAAESEWAWQYAFPGAVSSRNPRSGIVRRITLATRHFNGR